ncbi:hypothetical protein [Chitinimonas sp.]|uniref:hypothetical protein n=1 Tax=Chitinimonas sp. TaxID=1934313 RepID=UPI002F945FE0
MQKRQLTVEAAGVCCSVGYNLAAATCALRAGMDHFQESEFVTQEGAPVRVARLPDHEHWGAKRIANWIKLAVDDCLGQMPDLDTQTIPMIVICPTQDRPLVSDDWYQDTYRFAEAAIGRRFEARSAILPGGRAGFAQALQLAANWLQEAAVERVLIVGADCYLDSASISHYLDEGRLLVPGNRDGFLPGEAAAAVLLTKQALPGRLRVEGVGTATEAGRPDGSAPSRAIGLSQAIRGACEQAGMQPNALQFRMSDQNGEAFFAREAANAFTRVLWRSEGQPTVLTTADCVGEIGAATGPLMLAYLSTVMQRSDGPGTLGLIHLANDDGLRGAIAVRCQ